MNKSSDGDEDISSVFVSGLLNDRLNSRSESLRLQRISKESFVVRTRKVTCENAKLVLTHATCSTASAEFPVTIHVLPSQNDIHKCLMYRKKKGPVSMNVFHKEIAQLSWSVFENVIVNKKEIYNVDQAKKRTN